MIPSLRDAPIAGRRCGQYPAPRASGTRAKHYPHLGLRFRPIPKGLHLLAQGWTAGGKGAGGPTLGKAPAEATNPERVVANPGVLLRRDTPNRERSNPFRVDAFHGRFPRVAPPPLHPRQCNPGLKDRIPLGFSLRRAEDVGNAQSRGGEGAPAAAAVAVPRGARLKPA